MDAYLAISAAYESWRHSLVASAILIATLLIQGVVQTTDATDLYFVGDR